MTRAADMPLVSVLIPCYNAQAFVAEAIDSALNQDYPSIEVVAVDDGSTDATVQVLKQYGDRIRWEMGPNRGGSAARNRALALSKGAFIQFLDADDLLTPDKIRTQLPDLVADRADAVLCKLGLFGDGRERRAEKRPHPEPVGDPFSYFMTHPIGTPAPLHRRAMIERVGGFREGLRRGQEFDLHARLGAAGVRLSMVDQVLVWVRMHEGPRVSKNPQLASDFLDLLVKIVSEMRERGQMTQPRAKLLAPRVFAQAIAAYREGARAQAAAGFAVAQELDPGVALDERRVIRMARRLVGPLRTEAILATARSLKAKMT